MPKRVWTTGDLWQKFFADRGTHLAAMIAYFALLSFVPLTFLALALLGLTGRADESSFLVKEIKNTLPGTPIDRILGLVHAVQNNAAALGIIGGAALLWTSLSLFSVLESAFNIIYGRPNRSFLRGKGLATLLMISSLVTLFLALLAGSLGVSALREYAPGFVSSSITAYIVSIAVSLTGVFLFLVSCYYFLTNEELTVREVLPGAILAAIALEATFQVVPLYQRYADLNPGLRAFGAPAILLVWMYVMANVIVFGAELNWWFSRRRREAVQPELAGLASPVEQSARRLGSVGVRGLPFVAQFGNCPIVSLGHEHGIEAESFRASRLGRDRPPQRSRSAQHAAIRCDGHELRDVARTAAVAGYVGELSKQPADRIVAARACRAHAGPAAQALDLEA